MTIEPDSISSEAAGADISLVKAVLKRDRKATAEFVRLYTDHVYRFVWSRLSPRSDAVDDVVQETFLAAWSSLGTYSGSAPLGQWVLGIARHKIEDHYRRTLRESVAFPQEDTEQEIPAADEAIEELVDRERTAEKAADLISRLPYEYALLLRWRYWDQRSAREMAEETGKTEKAIERMLARAREQFRRLWTGQERR